MASLLIVAALRTVPFARADNNFRLQPRIDRHAALGYTRPFLLEGRSLMLRIAVIVSVLLSLIGAGGCSWVWQANNASEGVNIDTSKIGSGQSVFTPANDFGFVNGEPQDMRSRR
jgi:hypothetical protein